MGKKNLKLEAAWRKRLARFGRSNLTVTDFCRREGVAVASFYRWRERLEPSQHKSGASRGRSDQATSATGRAGPFVEVNVPSLGMAEVELPNGVRIRVPATNAEALRAAVLAGSEIGQEAAPC